MHTSIIEYSSYSGGGGVAYGKDQSLCQPIRNIHTKEMYAPSQSHNIEEVPLRVQFVFFQQHILTS